MHPHVHCIINLSLSAESSESLYHRCRPGMLRKYICGDDDHLAWKHPVSLGHVWYTGLRRINFVLGLGLIWSD